MKGRARRSVSLAGATTAACAMVMMSVQLQSMRGFCRNCGDCFSDRAGARGATGARGAEGAKGCDRCGAGGEGCKRTRRTPRGATRDAAPTTSDTPHAPNAPIAPIAPIAPLHLLHPLHLSHPFVCAAYFQARTHCQSAPVDASAETTQWRALATPGVEIASSARKISIGIASVFSRAGVSLARSF